MSKLSLISHNYYIINTMDLIVEILAQFSNDLFENILSFLPVLDLCRFI